MQTYDGERMVPRGEYVDIVVGSDQNRKIVATIKLNDGQSVQRNFSQVNGRAARNRTGILGLGNPRSIRLSYGPAVNSDYPVTKRHPNDPGCTRTTPPQPTVNKRAHSLQTY
jgi:hypothetical protein